MPPFLPRIGIAVIGQRVAERVISDCVPVVASELVFPVVVAVSIRNGVNKCAQCTNCVGILLLFKYVPAGVVNIDDCGVQPGVVLAEQLVQPVICICHLQDAVFADGLDVPVGVIGVGKAAISSIPQAFNSVEYVCKNHTEKIDDLTKEGFLRRKTKIYRDGRIVAD